MLFRVTERAKAAIEDNCKEIGGDVLPVISWSQGYSQPLGRWVFAGFSERQPANEPYTTSVCDIEFIVDGPINQLFC